MADILVIADEMTEVERTCFGDAVKTIGANRDGYVAHVIERFMLSKSSTRCKFERRRFNLASIYKGPTLRFGVGH